MSRCSLRKAMSQPHINCSELEQGSWQGVYQLVQGVARAQQGLYYMLLTLSEASADVRQSSWMPVNFGTTPSIFCSSQMPELVRERAGGQSLEASAMLPLNGTTEEVNKLMDALMAEHAARTAAKAAKKTKNGALKPPTGISGAVQPAALVAQQQAGIALAAANAAEAQSRVTSATAAADLKAAVAMLSKKHGRPQAAAQDLGLVTDAAMNGIGGSPAKKYRAAEHIPDGATKSVYSSIFIGDRQPVKETYSCRATSARGMNMV